MRASPKSAVKQFCNAFGAEMIDADQAIERIHFPGVEGKTEGQLNGSRSLLLCMRTVFGSEFKLYLAWPNHSLRLNSKTSLHRTRPLTKGAAKVSRTIDSRYVLAVPDLKSL